jgi:hypothetical protein
MLTSGVVHLVGDFPLPVDFEKHEVVSKGRGSVLQGCLDHGPRASQRIGTGALSVETPFSSKLSIATQYCCPTLSARSSSADPSSWKR